MMRTAPFLMLALAVSACSSAGAPRPLADPDPVLTETSTGTYVRVRVEGPSSALLEWDVERVWAVLPAVYEELGIETTVHDPEARAHGSRTFTRRRIGGEPVEALVRCGNEGAGPSAMSRQRIQLAIVTTLRPDVRGVTSVETEVSGTATPVDGASTSRTLCVSDGRIEQRILDALAARLAG